MEDLERASAQGSILAVQFNGHVYGQGYISNSPTATQRGTRVFIVLSIFALVGFIVYQKRSWFAKLLSRRKASIAALETSFGEAFCKPDENDDQETFKDDEPTEARARANEEYQETDLEIESLKQQISQERVRHELERMRREEYIAQLEKRIGSKETLEEAANEANLTYSS